jgi:hypothetical protein
MPTAIFVHGLASGPKHDWMRWLGERFYNNGYRVLTPKMPNAFWPQKDRWVGALNALAEPSKGRLVLVGHSLGGATILRYLEKSKRKRKVDLVVLVATPAWKHSPLLHSFFHRPFAWARIRKNARRFLIVHSKDDSMVSFENAKILAARLGAKVLEVDGYGHFHSVAETDVLQRVAKAMGVG